MAMKKKGAMQASTLVIALVLFFAIVAGFSGFYSEMAYQYNYTNPAIDKYNNLTGVQNDVSDMGSTVGNATVSDSTTTFFFISAGSIWRAFKFFFGFGNFVNGIVMMASKDLVLPDFVIVSLNILTLLIVIFAAIAAAMRKEI